MRPVGRQGSQEFVLTLRDSSLLDRALRPRTRRRLSGLAGAGQLERLREHGRKAGWEAERVHRRALNQVGVGGSAATVQQQVIERAIRAVGGRVLEHDVLTGSLRAILPGRGILAVASRPEVASIEAESSEIPLGLTMTTASVGAPSFWAAGFTGGGGRSDLAAADLGILHDKIEEAHPAFAGITFQRPADAAIGTTCGQQVSGCEHGTEVASVAISRGATGCAGCSEVDAVNRGLAPGLDSVLDAQATGPADDSAWALGIGSFGIRGASDPAEALSNSHGAVADADDSASLQGVDKLISAYGTLIAYPSGNEGPARSVNRSCIAYDTLCMGGFTPRGTVDPSDDVVEDFSSRGPTPGGRKKPDLVAVSTSEFANQHWIRDGRLWSGGSGTSLAAPQGRATASSPMGTQTGWQPDWGWGALDLDGALKERTNFYMQEVAGGDAHFYRATAEAPGDRATLVWNRRALGCIAPGCSTTSLTLSDLNLEQLDPATGAVEASSASAIDNVEQVRSPAAGAVIYKVKAASTVDGLPGEPYALAARRRLTPLGTPRPSVGVHLSAASAVRPGEPVQILADVTNPSADLSGQSATASLELAPGVELAPGSNPTTQTLGNLAPNATATVAWTVRARGDAVNRISVHAQASRYGETFGSDGTAAFSSDATAPTVGISAPAGATQEAAIPVSWTGADAGAGLRDFDVEVSTNDGPFAPWLTANSSTAGTYAGSPGSHYRFRVRASDRLGNTSSYVVSEEIAILAPTLEPPVGPPANPPVKSSAALRVRTIARRGSRIQIAGTLSRRATGRITFRLRGKSGRRAVKRSATAFPRAGRFKVALSLPRGASGILTVRYGGDDALAAAASRVRLRGL
jgi:serine protease AprX